MESGLFQNLSGDGYLSSDRRNSLLARSYAVRRRTTSNLLSNSTKGFKSEKDISAELKDFESYMSGTIYRYSNILETLVSATVERRIQRLEETIQQKVSVDDVAAYVLNRLPPMYATSRRGLQNLRQKLSLK